MKALIGIILMVLGVGFGLYVGVWLCFVGGIVQVIEQVRAENLEALQVAIGVARIIFSGLAGYLACFVLALPGFYMVKES